MSFSTSSVNVVTYSLPTRPFGTSYRRVCSFEMSRNEQLRNESVRPRLARWEHKWLQGGYTNKYNSQQLLQKLLHNVITWIYINISKRHSVLPNLDLENSVFVFFSSWLPSRLPINHWGKVTK